MLKILLSGSVILAISSFISRFMGIFRDHLLASNFGAGPELDAYFAAFRIPDLIYSLLVFSTISVAFLPHYLKVKKENGQSKANIITSRVLNLLLLSIGFLSIIIAVFATQFVDFYVHGFDDQTKQLTVSLMRVMLFSPIFFAFSSLAISVQNASHNFLTQAVSPILYNAGIIFSILFLVDSFGPTALAWGVFIGAFLQFIIQIPSLYSEGFKWYPVFKVNDEIRHLAKIAFPRILSMGIYQVSLTIDTFIATTLTAGSVAAINLAANIASLPLGVIVVSISITAFVYLSKQVEDNEKFIDTLELNIKKTVYWLFPALFGLYAISEPLINFLFLHGEFTQSDALLTKSILGFLLLSIGFQGFLPLLNRAYFARGNTIIPLKVSLVAMIVNIVVSFYLSKTHGAVGIAIGTAMGMFIYGLMLIFYTKRDFGDFLPIKFILKVLLSSVVMYAILYVINGEISNLNSLLQLTILGGTGTLFYLLINRFKIEIE